MQHSRHGRPCCCIPTLGMFWRPLAWQGLTVAGQPALLPTESRRSRWPPPRCSLCLPHAGPGRAVPAAQRRRQVALLPAACADGRLRPDAGGQPVAVAHPGPGGERPWVLVPLRLGIGRCAGRCRCRPCHCCALPPPPAVCICASCLPVQAGREGLRQRSRLPARWRASTFHAYGRLNFQAAAFLG